ncbi:hypothetical protein SKM57_03585 [Acinetobacter faecalis]|uniref:hypothetical protein n=1 Tax=Acinetobacter faecalis TaxID=2665161 RepID=UPI002A90A0AD|nr:hypothetical protein [Acinetobacter faecalis]MDY6467669.1 hypothetical protein [Acinetobacter faecalis]
MKKTTFQYFTFVVITIIYFLILSNFFNINFNTIQRLEPNALGDFLAGTFSPLGFILLLLGYLQNSKAIQMQNKELKNSILEQKQLVEISQRELKLAQEQYNNETYKKIIQAQPYFHFSEIHLKSTMLNNFKLIQLCFTLHNSRATCRDLKINIELSEQITSATVTVIELLESNNKVEGNVTLDMHNNNFKHKIFSENITLRYSDEFYNQNIQTFKITLFKENDDPNDLKVCSFFCTPLYESYKLKKDST